MLVSLTLACIVGATGEESGAGETPQPPDTASTGSGQASSASVLVATVTPVAREASSRLEALASLTPSATATSTPSASPIPEATETPEIAVAAEIRTEATPTETPVPPATETPSPSETPAPTETPTATSSPTPSPTASPSPTATDSPTATKTPSGNGGGATGFRATLLAGHNDARAQAGIGPLSVNGTLNQIAQERADAMASMDSMTHYNPDGSTVFDMMSDYGYAYTDGAENIAYNAGYSSSESIDVVMEQWLESPSHHENIMKAHLTYVGFGMATSASGKVYYSAVFSD